MRRERLQTGRVVTRTYSYNRPEAAPDEPPLPPPPPQPPLEPEPEPEPGLEPQSGPGLESEPGPDLEPGPQPEPVAPAEVAGPGPHPGALELLAGLRRHDPRLLLSERDVRRLAPDASAWLERGIAPDAVARAVSADLPDQMRNPAAVVAYRLTRLLPPRLPPAPVAPPVRDAEAPHPLQNCDGCDRAFRAPYPRRCRDCPCGRPGRGCGLKGRDPADAPEAGPAGAGQEPAARIEPVVGPLGSPTKQVTSRSPRIQVVACG